MSESTTNVLEYYAQHGIVEGLSVVRAGEALGTMPLGVHPHAGAIHDNRSRGPTAGRDTAPCSVSVRLVTTCASAGFNRLNAASNVSPCGQVST